MCPSQSQRFHQESKKKHLAAASDAKLSEPSVLMYLTENFPACTSACRTLVCLQRSDAALFSSAKLLPHILSLFSLCHHFFPHSLCSDSSKLQLENSDDQKEEAVR